MELAKFQQKFVRDLEPVYGKQEAISLFKIVVEEMLGLRAYQIPLNQGRELQEEESGKMEEVLQRLLQHEPIQHILGTAWFNGMSFRVNRHTLIPRQETEELVGWISGQPKVPGARILDIGTGSGCIAVSLAREFPDAEVVAVDKSREALEVAAENARSLGVEIRFIQQDILALESLDALLEEQENRSFNMIVSNPPYVRNLEKKEIRKNVLDYEPDSALFVADDDPLIFYRKIAQLAYSNLSPGGVLFFEINQYLGKETSALVEKTGFSTVELRKDLLGNNRMIKAIK